MVNPVEKMRWYFHDTWPILIVQGNHAVQCGHHLHLEDISRCLVPGNAVTKQQSLHGLSCATPGDYFLVEYGYDTKAPLNACKSI